MKLILEYIKDLAYNKRVLCTDGFIGEFSCKFNLPSNITEIENFERLTRCIIPKDLKDFLLYCNGISFFDTSDYSLFNLDDMIMVYETDVYLSGVYVIGLFCDDYILINSNEIASNRYMYVADCICPNECIPLDCNFEEFLRRLTSSNFSKYWTWLPSSKQEDFKNYTYPYI